MSNSATQPLVSVIMGSSSDLRVMNHTTQMLSELGIAFEQKVVSAHRTPELMQKFALGLEGRKIQVVIAGAGGAAHLPGMVASLTTVPVIGVPIALKHLSGMDSLLSIVSMPKGIPVATVAIDGAANAALLAARILGASHPEIHRSLISYMKKQQRKSLATHDLDEQQASSSASACRSSSTS